MLLQLLTTSLLLAAGQGLEEISDVGGNYPDDRQRTEVSNNSEVIAAPLSAPVTDYPSDAHWVFAQRGQVPYGALPANQNWQGQEPMYVARAEHKGSMTPGKLQSSHGHAYVSWGGREQAKQQYEVLVGGSNHWVSTSGSFVPSNALPGGETELGELLYICRVYHNNGIVTGKAQQSQGVCYVPYDGWEVGFAQYEILLA